MQQRIRDRSHSMIGKDLNFTDLIGLENWQGIQDSLAEVLGVTLRTFSEKGELLSKVSHSNRLLDEILPKSYKGSELCSEYLRLANKADLNNLKKENNLKYPFGLDVFLVPISAVRKKTIAYIAVGPIILKARKNIFDHTK